MNFPFYIAKRYLLAKKAKNAINIITLISVVGITVGTAALIVVISVFNGFDGLLKSLYSSYDPDLKIETVTGKVFDYKNSANFAELLQNEGIEYYSETLEENALLKYDDKQYIARLKGVDDNFQKVTGVDSMLSAGQFVLKDENSPYAIVGEGVAYYLSLRLNFVNPIIIYVPRRDAKLGANPVSSFNRKYIYPSGVFNIQQEYNTSYIILPIDFTRELLEYPTEVSALEIKVKDNADVDELHEEFQELLGKDYKVLNRYQQHEMFYKIMKSEKWMVFLILTFIIIIASFNIIGSLTMLIIEKKKDISILKSLGGNLRTIRKIFLFEGWMISIIGAIIGILIGLLVCWAQIQFGLVKLRGTGSFIISDYPVEVHFLDAVVILLTVLTIGFLSSWYPVRYITRRYAIKLEDSL